MATNPGWLAGRFLRKNLPSHFFALNCYDIYMQRSLSILSIFFFITATAFAQTTRRVLFLGNSYTQVNDLPQLVHDAALSAGDTLLFDSYTPGGYTLEAHSLDPVSQGKIAAGGWNYVVLQGQSQEPIFQTSVFNQGAYVLVDSIDQYNPCAVPLLYITWGRKNGDASNCASFPEVCTYAGMDSTLRNKYLNLANQLNCEVSPVSVVWKYVRQNFPGIELYNADESHPSMAGSYAAACCFYATIFKKDPTLITFNSTLSPADALIIRNAAKTQVFDQLALWDFKQMPQSGFYYTIGPGTNEVHFNPLNSGASQTYAWDFGDGFNSTSLNPIHAYASDGTYTVSLTTTNCDLEGMHTSTSDTVIQFCSHTPFVFATDSFLCEYDTLWTQPADSYQWYSGGSAIPETNEFLPNYHQYPSMDFSVLSTVAGCAELSQVYMANPQWSGYYFDAAMGGDPCTGGTALFIVLHTSASLTGNELIRWYRDGSLLASENDEDTLLITTQGTYYCTVIDPFTNCPFDTTYSTPIVFDCTIGIEENYPDVTVKVYPNPVSELLMIEWNMPGLEDIQVYTITGSLVSTMKISSATQLFVAGLPAGQYYIRFRNYPQLAVKFIKQ
jgi:PKD repeat protein